MTRLVTDYLDNSCKDFQIPTIARPCFILWKQLAQEFTEWQKN
ncbi:hypothetical protein [Treponema sp.]|nr:hypothetical protein [Treponema sp.]